MTLSQNPPGRKLPAALIATAAASGLLALTPPAREAANRTVAHYESCRLHAAADPQASVYAQLLAGRGDVGLAHLTEALTCDQASVSTAARDALESQVATWDELPRPEANRRLRVLAAALARHIDQLGPSAKQLAARQATNLLRRRDIQLGSAALADCETILRAAVYTAKPQAEARWNDDIAEDRHAPSDSLVDMHPHLLDEMLPESYGSPLNAQAADLADSSNDDVPALLDRAVLQPESSAMKPLRIDLLAGQQASIMRVMHGNVPLGTRFDQPSPDITGDHVRDARQSSSSERAHHADSASSVDDQQTLELMHRLSSQDESEVAAAERELARQGFNARHLELAGQLTSADAAVRVALAESLPGVSGIDASGWLTWLSRDSDADVRLAALTVLASSSDPRLLRRVAKVASQDADSRIQRLASRIAPGADR